MPPTVVKEAGAGAGRPRKPSKEPEVVGKGKKAEEGEARREAPGAKPEAKAEAKPAAPKEEKKEKKETK